LIAIILHSLIAFVLEIILARAQVRVMSDGKEISKKKPLKEVIKFFAPLILIIGIAVGIVYLFITYPPYSSNVFMLSLNLWLAALDINLATIFATYIAKGILRSSITGLRLKVIREVKLITIAARIFTVIDIVTISLVLVTVTYLFYLRAVASGSTKIPALLTSQEAILLLLLLVTLLPLTYVTKRETEKVIRLGMENVMNA